LLLIGIKRKFHPIINSKESFQIMSISRKDFLKKVGVLSVAGVSTAALAACGGGSDEKKMVKKAADPCKDMTGVSEAELGKRTTFKYVDMSADPKKVCTGCALFKPAAAGATCGGCTLFAGPVSDKGFCNAWAAKPNMG
jgi:hypothetical protein